MSSVARRNIVLMSDQPATASAVHSALESSGVNGSGSAPAGENVCRDVRDLAARLEKTGAHAALVDIDGRPNQILASLEPVVRRFPETRFIVLANSMESELMLEAMQMGARHFMAKESIPATLAGVLDRLCANGAATRNGQERESQGVVVSVLSASGGCGATTVAVNLAAEIEQGGSESNLLIDLDYNYGAVGAYLGLDAPHGAADLMGRGNAIDPELIDTTALNYSDKMKVLISASSAMLGEASQAGYGRLEEILRGCKRSYRATVIDAPRVTSAAAATLARHSTITLMVLQLAVKDIRMARAMLSAMTAQGVNPASVLVLINRYHKRTSMIKLEEAEKALGGFAIRCLSNDFSSVSRGMNFGQPLHKASPRSVVRKELEQIAGEIMNGSLTRGVGAAAAVR